MSLYQNLNVYSSLMSDAFFPHVERAETKLRTFFQPSDIYKLMSDGCLTSILKFWKVILMNVCVFSFVV
jgi:hypothetical protein